jgi:DNA-binding LacI/PurR family transcriptional regulator
MPAKHDQQVLCRWPSTIWDVARVAGVSVSTVSKALNGRGQLREQTRSLVQSAAERLNFRPNNLAQSLLRKRSFTVGLITTDSHGRFSIPLLEASKMYSRPRGYPFSCAPLPTTWRASGIT